MQTFLPYPDFLQSAQVLDKQRCWKQVVEAKQIINILTACVELPPQSDSLQKSIPWRNHPAVRMWEGHIEELKIYFNVFLHVCKSKHKINTKYVPYKFKSIVESCVLGSSLYLLEVGKPWWLEMKIFIEQ